jgi:hypothetical protein
MKGNATEFPHELTGGSAGAAETVALGEVGLHLVRPLDTAGMLGQGNAPEDGWPGDGLPDLPPGVTEADYVQHLRTARMLVSSHELVASIRASGLNPGAGVSGEQREQLREELARRSVELRYERMRRVAAEALSAAIDNGLYRQ